MSEFQGKVSGIDVIATPGQPTSRFAFGGFLHQGAELKLGTPLTKIKVKNIDTLPGPCPPA